MRAITSFEEMTSEEKLAYEKHMRLQYLKNELSKYDYIGVKIATGVATIEEYADKIAYCEQLRNEIRTLEN